MRAGRTEPCSQGQEQGALGQEIVGGFLKEARFQQDLKDGKGQVANTQGISSRQRSVFEGCAKPEWELGPGYPGKEPGGCGCPGCQVGTDRPPDCRRALGTAVNLVGDDGGFSSGWGAGNKAVSFQPAEEASGLSVCWTGSGGWVGRGHLGQLAVWHV